MVVVEVVVTAKLPGSKLFPVIFYSVSCVFSGFINKNVSK